MLLLTSYVENAGMLFEVEYPLRLSNYCKVLAVHR